MVLASAVLGLLLMAHLAGGIRCEVRGLVYPADPDRVSTLLEVHPQTCPIEWGMRDRTLYFRDAANSDMIIMIEIPRFDNEHRPLRGWIDFRYMWKSSIAWFDRQRIAVPVLYGPKVPA